jgi:dephospho-CoA kinase
MRRDPGESLKLGVTGGIGSGKTTVCKVFSILGIPVFSADDEAKSIQESDRDIQLKINSFVGKDLFPEGKLDRTELARLIFSNKELLEKVSSVVHPAVFRSFGEWVKKQNTPYSIMEAAILFESGGFRLMDRIVTVVTPIEERIERLVRSKKLSREQILDRIKNQIDEESRITRSDFVIFNSESEMIIPTILGIHKEMIKLHDTII